MTPSKTLFFLCISFVVGILLESITKTSQFFILGFLFAGIFAIIIFFIFKKDNFAIIGFCIFLLIIGILRMQISEFNIANDELGQFNGKGQITLIGVISDDPDVRDTSQKLKVKINNSAVLVTTNRYPEYKYLDEIKITGKLEAPMVFDDFNYKNYLLKDHIYSVMGFPKIEIASQEHKYNAFLRPLKVLSEGGSYLYEKILFLKHKLRTSIQNNFLPPQSSILEGIILGDKSAVGQDIKDKFRITGLSHIIAVSGMHVVILSSIIMSFLLFLGLWRRQAFYGAIIFIFIYVVLVGLPPSGIRAGIMGVIYLSGQALGKQTTGSRIIVLAGALMLLFNPLLLFYDVGFQLSFFAVLGLIYFEPLVRNFIKFLINKFLKIKINEKYEGGIMLLTATISAQIFTLPIIIYNFGNVSFVSPITNILIMPIIYYLMFFGFISSLVGIIWGSFGWLLSIPCHFLMTYFLWVIDIFSKPWAHKIIPNVLWVWPMIFYLLIGLFVWFLNRKYSQKFV